MTRHNSARRGSIGNWLRSKVSGRRSPHANRRRPTELETLESREMLAGDVSVAVVGGKLKIDGDGQSNGVELTAGETSGSYVVRGIAQSGATTVNGHESVTVTGVTRKVKFDMAGGDDLVVLHAAGGNNLTLPESLKVFGGTGNDRVSLTTDHSGIKIFNAVLFELGAGDDVVELIAEGIGNGIVAKRGLTAAMGAGEDSVMFDAIEGSARVKVKGDTLIQLDGGNDQAVLMAHDADTRVQMKGKLTVSTGDSDDTVRLEALAGNASLTVTGAVDITTGSGDDQVRVQAQSDSALVDLRGDVSIATAVGEDNVLIEAIDDSAGLLVGGSLSATTGADDDFIRVQAKNNATRVTVAGTTLIDAGSSFDLAGDQIAIRAMTGSAAVTFHGSATIQNGDSRRAGNGIALRSDADHTSIRFNQDLSINLGSDQNLGELDVLARTGDALIAVAGKLKVNSGAGDTLIRLESRFENAAIRVGGSAVFQTGGDKDEVELLTGADNTEITVGNDLKVRLGDDKDVLKLTGVEVFDFGILDGEEGIDTFIDGGGNTYGTLVIDFEL